MILTKAISSLEKPFADQKITDFQERNKLSALRGERVSFQLIYTYKMDDEGREWTPYYVKASGALAAYCKLYALRNVGVQKPCFAFDITKADKNYLRTTPGIYPDLITPLGVSGKFVASADILNSIWIDIEIPENTPLVGEQSFTVDIFKVKDNSKVATHTYTVDILPISLPEEKLLYTQFIYHEVLSSYYVIPAYSKKHWQIIENFITLARKEGMNTLYTPHTLVKLTKTAPGKYRTDISRLKKYVEMGNRLGYKKIEISHLFTAGNCAHPTLFYYEDGEKKSMSHMSSTDPEVTAALRATLTAIIRYFKKYDDDSRLIFHVADEPSFSNIENFKLARDTVADLIDPYEGVDALYGVSEEIAEYYHKGLIKNPSPETPHVEYFHSLGVEKLWTYYCCGPTEEYSNRFIAMSSSVTRSLAIQLFKFNIYGFLHWGISYYGGGDCGGNTIPYVDQSAQNWVSAGDTFSLYPAMDGTAYESVRAVIMQQVLQDLRAMQLCETLYSHEEVVSEIENIFGKEIHFNTCVHEIDIMESIREKINEMIREKL